MPTQMRGIAGDERVKLRLGNQVLECRVVADRWWYDTETLTTTEAEQKYFITLAGKAGWQANFEGDKSLVKEREYALIFGMHATAVLDSLASSLAIEDMIDTFFGSSYEMKVNDVVVAEGNCLELVGGPGWQIYTSPVQAVGADLTIAQGGSMTQDNLRKFWKPILVTGGRSIDFLLRTPNARAVDIKVKVKLYGLHLIPVGRALTREQAAAAELVAAR